MLIFLPASGLVLWPSKAPHGRGVQTAAGRFKIPEGPFQEHKGEVQAADPQAAILAETLACLVMPRTPDPGPGLAVRLGVTARGCRGCAAPGSPPWCGSSSSIPTPAQGRAQVRTGWASSLLPRPTSARPATASLEYSASSPGALSRTVEKCQSWASVAASARIWSRGAASAAARIACWAGGSMAWLTWCWTRLKAVW